MGPPTSKLVNIQAPTRSVQAARRPRAGAPCFGFSITEPPFRGALHDPYLGPGHLGTASAEGSGVVRRSTVGPLIGNGLQPKSNKSVQLFFVLPFCVLPNLGCLWISKSTSVKAVKTFVGKTMMEGPFRKILQIPHRW